MDWIHIFTLLTSISTLIGLFLSLWFQRKNRQQREALKYIEVKIQIYKDTIKNIRHALSYSQDDFLKFKTEILGDSYYEFWLYASDNTIKSLNKLIDARVLPHKKVSHDKLTELYQYTILEMRRDLYPHHKLNLSDIRILINQLRGVH